MKRTLMKLSSHMPSVSIDKAEEHMKRTLMKLSSHMPSVSIDKAEENI